MCVGGVGGMGGRLQGVRRGAQEIHDVMFEFACDQPRFAVKRFSVGLRKR